MSDPRVTRLELSHDGHQTKVVLTLTRSSTWTSDEEADPGDLPQDFQSRLLRWLRDGS